MRTLSAFNDSLSSLFNVSCQMGLTISGSTLTLVLSLARSQMKTADGTGGNIDNFSLLELLPPSERTRKWRAVSWLTLSFRSAT